MVYIYPGLVHAFASIVHSDLSDDLTVCFEVLSCFFDHPSIDSNKKMSLSPFKGCLEVSSLFLLRGLKDRSVDVTEWMAADHQAR